MKIKFAVSGILTGLGYVDHEVLVADSKPVDLDNME